ncbi:MAG: tRNA uridine-5-carboxymethylaminomethyl(34) synthesis GTPase MnmE [Clostridia bacterium]|nr:tRNA uridine-5-carboxymethylaminomethyl(34) synthesis GTPase MnmE [Clostridia bacterium]MDD4049022.1 tRNA uridine-5-carboxymethylaminomethyl(34) synthesis GTPase MnmE [Clostridia bacterium]
MFSKVTIAAISTAYGTSGVGIIRISGDDALNIVDTIFRSKKGIKIKDKKTYSITYGHIFDENGITLDEVIILKMLAPHSYTGEDVVEIQCHGGVIVLNTILEVVLNRGAILAEPGEFSKRAFLNGKIDLSQAEAIIDLINAKTKTAMRVASNNLNGMLKYKIDECKKIFIEILADIEADIDFPEEDIERLNNKEILVMIDDLNSKILKLLDTFKNGRIVREGLKTVLIGNTNVGKSSLLNTLLNTNRSIVTDIHGTTRDLIEEYYNMGGIPLILTDTAGIRETDDIVEKIGVEKTKEAIKNADLIIYIFDVMKGICEEDISNLNSLDKSKVIVLANKLDLLNTNSSIKKEEINKRLDDYRVLFISATKKIGISELEYEIKDMFFDGKVEINDEATISNIRQKVALEKAHQSLQSASLSISKGLPLNVISIDITNALVNLQEITGEALDENIIDKIFSKFCLGK